MRVPFHSLASAGRALCLAKDWQDFYEWAIRNGLDFRKHRTPILVIHPSQLEFHNWHNRPPKRCYVTSKAKEFWAFNECQAKLNAAKVEIFYMVPEEDL